MSGEEKYILRYEDGDVEPVSTYQSRWKGKWVAWVPATVGREPGEQWDTLLDRLKGYPGVLFAVSGRQRLAAVELARKAEAVLYAADGLSLDFEEAT